MPYVPEILFFQSSSSTYVITIPCVLCLMGWCLTKSIWIYLQISQNKQQVQWRTIYFPKSRTILFTCTKDLCRIINWKKIADIKKTLRSYHFIEKYQLWKYLSGVLSIDNDETDQEIKEISSSMILATLI